jgi:hypothetical protein
VEDAIKVFRDAGQEHRRRNEVRRLKHDDPARYRQLIERAEQLRSESESWLFSVTLTRLGRPATADEGRRTAKKFGWKEIVSLEPDGLDAGTFLARLNRRDMVRVLRYGSVERTIGWYRAVATMPPFRNERPSPESSDMAVPATEATVSEGVTSSLRSQSGSVRAGKELVEDADRITAAALQAKEEATRGYDLESGRVFDRVVSEGKPVNRAGWIWVNRTLHGDPWADAQELSNMKVGLDLWLDELETPAGPELKKLLESLEALESPYSSTSVEDLLLLHERWTAIVRARLYIDAAVVSETIPDIAPLAPARQLVQGSREYVVYHLMREWLVRSQEDFFFLEPDTGMPSRPARAVMRLIGYSSMAASEAADIIASGAPPGRRP